MLTVKQHQLLVFIIETQTERGVSPSFDEMKDALDLKSKSGIHRLLGGLEERGFIRRLNHRARAIEVLEAPPEYHGGFLSPKRADELRARVQELEETLGATSGVIRVLEYAAHLDGDVRRGIFVKAYVEEEPWALRDFEMWREARDILDCP